MPSSKRTKQTLKTVSITTPIFMRRAGNRFVHEIYGIASAKRLSERRHFSQPEMVARQFKKCDCFSSVTVEIPNVAILE
jgi:hypothetical protein